MMTDKNNVLAVCLGGKRDKEEGLGMGLLPSK